MTSAWVDECARVAALISATRDGCCISNGMRLSTECTRIDDIISKLQCPTEYEQWEATILATQERLQHREQLEPDWQSWQYATGGLEASFVFPEPHPVDKNDWEDAVVRWARSVSDVQAEIDELLVLTQQLAAERADEEQTEQMAAEQSDLLACGAAAARSASPLLELPKRGRPLVPRAAASCSGTGESSGGLAPQPCR